MTPNGKPLRSTGTIFPLAANALFVLSNPYELDGRVTSHPGDAQGYAPSQAYVLKEGDTALLVGTGLTIHEDQILAQLKAVLGSTTRLSYLASTPDFTRHCNARAIADRFGMRFVYQLPLYEDVPSAWLNFRPDVPTDETDGLRRAEAKMVRTGQPIFVDSEGTRLVDVIVPALRLLPFNWLYDRATRTMFTIDIFTWIWRQDDLGPWVVTEEDEDSTTIETVQHALFGNRYWWLAGADTSRIRRALADTFERYEVDNIAPEVGCALKGSKVVSHHYQLLDDVLARAPQEQPQGVEVGTWTFAARDAVVQ